jgi:hypothetical protein
MILFVPAYDPATEANLAIAVRLDGSHLAMLSEGATRQALLHALKRAGEPLFAMAHGRSDRLLAQEGGTALSKTDAAALGSRPVFAFACYTAADLGRAAAGAGATWWGYTGAITSPDVAGEVLPLLAEIFVYLFGAFAGAGSAAARRAVLIQIKERCHAAESRIDVLLETDPDLDAGTAYLCLLHLWDRLRIWEERAESPLQHPEARPPLLFPAG